MTTIEIHDTSKRNIILISDDEQWKVWAGQITESWQKCVKGIVETGQLLIEATTELKRQRGQFERMVESKLPFGPRTARMLMYIAEHPVIANRKHVSVLPPSWGTLYQLAHLPPAVIEEKIESGEINPKMERKDAVALLPRAAKAKKAPPPASRAKPDAHATVEAKPSVAAAKLTVDAAVKRVTDMLMALLSKKDKMEFIARLRPLLDAAEKGPTS